MTDILYFSRVFQFSEFFYKSLKLSFIIKLFDY